MPVFSVVVGDLLSDPTAQSFISLADADAYIGIEQHAKWDLARPDQKTASLVRASRWLSLQYNWYPLDARSLPRVGIIAARIAAETVDVHIFTGDNVSEAVQSERFGEVSFTYRTDLVADAAGLSWSWLNNALHGLVAPFGEIRNGLGVLVV